MKTHEGKFKKKKFKNNFSAESNRSSTRKYLIVLIINVRVMATTIATIIKKKSSG